VLRRRRDAGPCQGTKGKARSIVRASHCRTGRVPRPKAPGTAGRGRPKALVERATLVLATTGLGRVVGFQESVLLRLLAEPAGARPGDA
jgi:hypothetical protein